MRVSFDRRAFDADPFVRRWSWASAAGLVIHDADSAPRLESRRRIAKKGHTILDLRVHVDHQYRIQGSQRFPGNPATNRLERLTLHILGEHPPVGTDSTG
jgi:hypothetical protein